MSHRIAAKIPGVAGYVPPKVLTNADLERMVETNDEWIRTRTGIRERHIAEEGMASSHLATEAAKTLLEKTKTDPSEIDLIIVASVTPDMFFPATACLVQDRLGAKRAWGFDLSAACSGFAYALTVGAQFVGSGAHRKVLVIGSEVMSSILDYKDRATCLLFGDGAGPVLSEASKVMVNIDKYGNTTGGTIPLGLRDAVEQGRLRKGDLVLLAAVGAGYTTGGLLMRWAY